MTTEVTHTRQKSYDEPSRPKRLPFYLAALAMVLAAAMGGIALFVRMGPMKRKMSPREKLLRSRRISLPTW